MEPWLLLVALCSIITGYFIGSSLSTVPIIKVDQPNKFILCPKKINITLCDIY